MNVTDLRIALFSGNYNYTRDGANQALNRLADYLLRQGAALRVYSPVVAERNQHLNQPLVVPLIPPEHFPHLRAAAVPE